MRKLWEKFKRWRRRFSDVISFNGSPYLYRYRLWSSKSLGIYLHCIVREDSDRNLHDHPFAFNTLILWGGYYEHTPIGRFWRRPGTVLHRDATDLHRIELTRPAWTLFIRGHRVREWGFSTPDGWVPHTEYENLGTYASQQKGESGAS